MAAPMGYFLTWVTYGSWLPGDLRGWVDKHTAGPGVPVQDPDAQRETAARARMPESPVRLEPSDRQTVEAAIRETCAYRAWAVHAASIRSNHAHVVITADGFEPGEVLRIIKAYASRALNQRYPHLGRRHWWAQGGSKRYLNDLKSFQAAIEYVETQDDAEYHGPPRDESPRQPNAH